MIWSKPYQSYMGKFSLAQDYTLPLPYPGTAINICCDQWAMQVTLKRKLSSGMHQGFEIVNLILVWHHIGMSAHSTIWHLLENGHHWSSRSSEFVHQILPEHNKKTKWVLVIVATEQKRSQNFSPTAKRSVIKEVVGKNRLKLDRKEELTKNFKWSWVNWFNDRPYRSTFC